MTTNEFSKEYCHQLLKENGVTNFKLVEFYQGGNVAANAVYAMPAQVDQFYFLRINVGFSQATPPQQVIIGTQGVQLARLWSDPTAVGFVDLLAMVAGIGSLPVAFYVCNAFQMQSNALAKSTFILQGWKVTLT